MANAGIHRKSATKQHLPYDKKNLKTALFQPEVLEVKCENLAPTKLGSS